MSSYDPSSYDPDAYDPRAFVAPPPGGGNRTANVPGRIAMIAGVALVLLQVARIPVIFSMPFDPMGGSGLWQATDLAFGIGEALLALAATIFGAIGLGGRTRPRGSAAAGLALGASTLVLIVVHTIMPLLT